MSIEAPEPGHVQDADADLDTSRVDDAEADHDAAVDAGADHLAAGHADRIRDAEADPEAAYDAAADAVAAGQVIVLPTDTVYGVGADAFSAAAVQRLLDAKHRGRDMPPPVLVAEVGMVRSLAARVDERVLALADAFWPGPLTLVLTSPDSLRMDLGDRGQTIAVRVPDHDFARELLRRTGPLAVSSANVSGRDAALTIGDAVEQLGDSVAIYLDAGTMSGPVPSTILDLSGETPRLLRAGRLSVAEINAVVPGLLAEPEEPSAPGESGETAAAVELGLSPEPGEEPSEAEASAESAGDQAVRAASEPAVETSEDAVETIGPAVETSEDAEPDATDG